MTAKELELKELRQSLKDKKKDVQKRQDQEMREEVEALDRGTTDELLARRNRVLDDKVEDVFRKREAKCNDKEEEKHLKQDKEVQAQASQSKEEKAGARFMELISKLGLGTCNVNHYININNYSRKSSDSDNTATFKAFMRNVEAKNHQEVAQRKSAERKVNICEQDI